MKYPKKKGMLKYVLVIVAVVFVYLVVSKIDEGFQTETTVYLYFDKDPSKKPKFISSTDPRVRYISSAVESVNIQLDPSLGTLKRFHGATWSPANNNWLAVPATALDKNVGNSLTLENNAKRILSPSTSVTGNYAPSFGNKKLPQPVSAISGDIIIKKFASPAFNFVTKTSSPTNDGDPANNNAKYRVDLTF